MQQRPITSPERPPHHRGPRRWPVLRTEPIALPYPMPQNQPPLTSLLITGASLVGIALSFLLMGRGGAAGGGGFGIGLLAISGTTALASILTFVWQDRGARQANSAILDQYRRELDRLVATPNGRKPGVAMLAAGAERKARWENDPPLLAPDAADPLAGTLIPAVEANPAKLWQRRPEDPDFLAVRVGVGHAAPHFAVQIEGAPSGLTAPIKHVGFQEQHERARNAVTYFERLQNVPVIVPLREHSGVALLGGPGGAAAAGLARALLGQVTLHHSPRDVHVVIIAPAQAAPQWDWARGLGAGISSLPVLIVGDAPAREPPLERLLGELTRRQSALSDHSRDRSSAPPLPHLVLVVDATQPGDLALLANPAVERALGAGKELGATVVSLHTYLDQAPAQATIAVDMRESKVLSLWPNPPAPVECQSLDDLSVADCARLSHALSRYTPEVEAGQQLPEQVKLLTLLTPPIGNVLGYDANQIQQTWEATRRKAAAARALGQVSCAIPLGKGYGRQPLELDFVSQGPHGLLIGQTGSGKSQLLRSMITALAVQYPPDMVNLVLVDYKGGLELEVFNQLPHTLAMLTNLAQAGQTKRFLDLLESEIRDRQALRKQGKELRRLFVIIDEFAEMVSSQGPNSQGEVILESLLRILRLGRALDVHLLFASQRPEGSAIGKLSGYVQYRISLRTNTEEDSRQVLGSPVAAHLPLQPRGRACLLRGDGDLQLFQAAQSAVATGPRNPATGEDLPTADEVLAERMRTLQGSAPTTRWPKSLPTPGENPTPLILVIHGGLTPVEDAWNATARAQLPPMVAPLGLYDRPSQRQRDWFHADLLGHQGRLQGGPLLVMGDLNAGKTTTLQTLLLYFAQHYSPRDLRWYVLDPAGAFQDFVALPHASDFFDPQQRNIISGLDEKELQAFIARFDRASASGTARDRPPLLLVIDDYDELNARVGSGVKPQFQELAQKAIRGRPNQVYLALSAARTGFDALPTSMISSMATKIALYMSNRDNLSAILGGRIPFAPDPVAGRGFAQTRSSLDEIQIAAPTYGATELDRATSLQQVLARIREQGR